MRRPVLLIAVTLALLATAACGSDGDSTADTSLGSSQSTVIADLDGDLPPKDATSIESLYEDELAAIGMRLTPRGGLIDRSNGGYEHSGNGDHLALYVEPIKDRTTVEYVAGISEVTKIFAGDVFERWPKLVSFDVCQEPTSEVDGRPEPVAVTQIEMTRQEAARFDWDTVTLEELVAASKATPQGLVLNVSSLISGDPDFQAVSAPAG